MSGQIDELTWLVVLAFFVAFYMAWGIGANDVANTFATPVGAKVLTLRQAVIVAGVCELAGAVLMGSHVSKTVRKGIISTSDYEDNPEYLMLGMFCALVGAGTWLMIATKMSLPVSTTHSIIGAIIGFAIADNGTSGVKWDKVQQIVMSWAVSPLLAGIVGGTIFLFCRSYVLRRRDPVKYGFRFLPLLWAVTMGINIIFIIYKGTPQLGLKDTPLWLALAIGIASGIAVCGCTAVCLVPCLRWRLKETMHRRNLEKEEQGEQIDTAARAIGGDTTHDVQSGGLTRVLRALEAFHTAVLNKFDEATAPVQRVMVRMGLLPPAGFMDYEKMGSAPGADEQDSDAIAAQDSSEQDGAWSESTDSVTKAKADIAAAEEVEKNAAAPEKEKPRSMLSRLMRGDSDKTKKPEDAPIDAVPTLPETVAMKTLGPVAADVTVEEAEDEEEEEEWRLGGAIGAIRDILIGPPPKRKAKDQSKPSVSIWQKITKSDHNVHKLHGKAEVFSDASEQQFKYLQLFTSMFGAFAHGANDVANAIGPLAAVYMIYNDGAVKKKGDVPVWILMIGGLGIVLGLAMWGWRVIQVVGGKLAKVTPTRGFAIELGSASAVVVASRLALPVSTTHCQVGAVVAIGLAEGHSGLNWTLFAHIVLSWIATLPFAGMVSALFYILLKPAVDASMGNPV